eukprot:PhF_6_TR11311/c0_g1_i1/m.18258
MPPAAPSSGVNDSSPQYTIKNIGTYKQEALPSYPMGSDADVSQGIKGMQRDVPYPPPRNFFERYKMILAGKYEDPEMPKEGPKKRPPFLGNFERPNLWKWVTSGTFNPLTPETYADPYVRKNPCPEEFWRHPWHWPETRYMNPKIPPPQDGKYQDYYHYAAFRNWFIHERTVYLAECMLVKEALDRCYVKEGQINYVKNCKHIFNKYFSMTRYEEIHQMLLYMAMTGNKVIRETPYPADFVEQKRKIYDQWLTRTRMKQPGDKY